MTANANANVGLLTKLAQSLGLSKAETAIALSAIDDAQVLDAVGKIASGGVGKASMATGSALTPTEHVPTLWDSQQTLHGAPSKEEITVGPSQASSGGGAERMIAEYSHPAPQNGTQMAAEKLAEELGQMRAYMKSFAEAFNAYGRSTNEQISTLATAVSALLQKGATAKAEDSEEEEDTETEVVEIKSAAAAAAKAAFEVAKGLVKKADDIEEEEEEEEEEAKAKALRRSIRQTRKAAGKAFGRAATRALAAKDKALFAAILKAAKKADIAVVNEDEEDEDDEAEKARKANAAAAKSDDKGNQADKQDPASGNQDDAAAKAHAAIAAAIKAATEEAVTKAIEGITPLKMSLGQVMDVISGRPRTDAVAPVASTLAKADPVALFGQINDLIAQGAEDGVLSPGDEMSAKSLLSVLTGTQSGDIPASIFTEKLAVASPAVQSIFAMAA